MHRPIKSGNIGEWKDALQKEYDSLMEFGVFSIVKLIDQNVVGTRWILTTKESPIETIKKARFVVQGNYQVPGRNFMETYAPTICKELLKSLIG
jgi:Reverse transcriptase (RNA-dependent DNA polymerase)